MHNYTKTISLLSVQLFILNNKQLHITYCLKWDKIIPLKFCVPWNWRTLLFFAFAFAFADKTFCFQFSSGVHACCCWATYADKTSSLYLFLHPSLFLSPSLFIPPSLFLLPLSIYIIFRFWTQNNFKTVWVWSQHCVVFCLENEMSN